MLTERHKEIAGKIWEIANRLRGPYRPPQYRLVMLPMVVLRRLDCVLEPTKDAVLAEYAKRQAAGTPETAIPRILTKIVNFDRTQPLYNVSPYTFAKLLGDSENIAPNLVAYINGFSDTARRIFEKFKFGDQIEKLDSSNRLYAIVQAMAGIDLHPERVSNIEMGYIFEHLVMRFGAGLPAINDGSLLFLQHMISKMKGPPENGGEGSKIAIIFNGSPLFSGDAGSGPSNIRRWIIENDWLDAIVALPDQLFYNTGIFTYVWLVTNRKAAERRGKVQLIDGSRFFQKMKKSLNNKRNELSDGHIARLTEIYGDFRDGERETVPIDGTAEERVVSRIFENREFGFLKVTVERPLRLNFEGTAERITRLDEQSAFAGLAVPKKRKDAKAVEVEEAEGRTQQDAIRAMLVKLAPRGRYMDRGRFEADMDAAARRAGLKLPAPIKKAIFAALRNWSGSMLSSATWRLSSQGPAMGPSSRSTMTWPSSSSGSSR